ncbi:MAG: Holliday junction resolvase-like protein [Thermoproteota archaeon]
MIIELITFLGILVLILIGYTLHLRSKLSKMEKTLESRVKKTLERSRAVLKGKIGEQFVPFFMEFGYNPSDARFLGAPIDYVVFDGYTDVKDRKTDRAIDIILLDIKTGEHATLSHQQKKIKEGVEKGNIRWETLHLKKSKWSS